MTDSKILAIAAHLSVPADTIDETKYDTYAADGCEYRVLTSQERDDEIEAQIENYIEECILPEIPEAYRGYFDTDAYKRDVHCNGEGDSFISSYDGAAHESKVDGEWYYVIRVS